MSLQLIRSPCVSGSIHGVIQRNWRCGRFAKLRPAAEVPLAAEYPGEELEADVVSLKQALRSATRPPREVHPDEELTSETFLGPGVDPERVLLVGISLKKPKREIDASIYALDESLAELANLAETAGLEVISQTYQYCQSPNPGTYIGSGKLEEIADIVKRLDISTVIFDDELSPVQLMNIEKAIGNAVRICDRTALTLDIFAQHARTKEGKLQVKLAQFKYQMPRLTRMWTHLERQVAGAGGNRAVRGMGEKQIEVDKRILRKRMSAITKELEEVKLQRRLKRNKRLEGGMPVVTLVGYTNAGKSTVLNALTEADVLVEDQLFATLDPTTKRLRLPSGKVALLTDTVGFIQKLPPQLIAAFSATLEELMDSSLLVHVVDISSIHSLKQQEAVQKVLKTLGADEIPELTVWNKCDQLPPDERERVANACASKSDVVCISAATGEGLDELCMAIERRIEESMVPYIVRIPYKYGELVQRIHTYGVVKHVEHDSDGTFIEASVPLNLASQLKPFQIDSISEQ